MYRRAPATGVVTFAAALPGVHSRAGAGLGGYQHLACLAEASHQGRRRFGNAGGGVEVDHPCRGAPLERMAGEAGVGLGPPGHLTGVVDVVGSAGRAEAGCGKRPQVDRRPVRAPQCRVEHGARRIGVGRPADHVPGAVDVEAVALRAADRGQVNLPVGSTSLDGAARLPHETHGSARMPPSLHRRSCCPRRPPSAARWASPGCRCRRSGSTAQPVPTTPDR